MVKEIAAVVADEVVLELSESEVEALLLEVADVIEESAFTPDVDEALVTEVSIEESDLACVVVTDLAEVSEAEESEVIDSVDAELATVAVELGEAASVDVEELDSAAALAKAENLSEGFTDERKEPENLNLNFALMPLRATCAALDGSNSMAICSLESWIDSFLAIFSS